MGPIFAIITFNMAVVVVATVIVIKHKRGVMARKKESLNSKTVIRLTFSITGVMLIFGLSWLFGALTITVQEVRLAFQIPFAVFTSLQGFFIFLFFCVLSKEARESWKEILSCGHYKSTFLNPNLRFSSKDPPSKVDLSKTQARNFAVAGNDEIVAETDAVVMENYQATAVFAATMVTSETTPNGQEEMEAGDFTSDSGTSAESNFISQYYNFAKAT